MEPEIAIEIPIRTSTMTMLEVVEWVNYMQEHHPDREYYLDGDLYAIVSKKIKE